MPAEYPKKPFFHLTSADEALLQKFAPLFDIEFRQVDEGTYCLHALDIEEGCEVILPAAVAHRRLFAEVSERAVRWVHFHLGTSCRDSLLGQSETGLKRVSELYARDHDTARPLAI
ncbi:hypothetical protein LP414_09425 [Polaromonas sp. P1(28)-13]|nr:hypothetical protein LP414_09425 [Polaromonas sp. P1(28)-13]